MTFDEIHNEPCLLPQVGAVSCTTAPPIINEDAELFLRPEVAIVEILGSVQYRTFVIANGVEMEVTNGLTYSSADTGIALIGAIGGHATGVAEGIVTISVTWQGLEAFAQLQVVASCGDVNAGLMVVIDHSESMSQSFGFGQGTKLDFAKLLAKQFIGEVNTTKDTVGLVQFGVDAQLLEPLTSDNVAVATTLMGVQWVPGETDITSGLQLAIDNLTVVDRRVIVLFTDGGHNDDEEPVQLARQFRSGGGVIIVVALRAGPQAFMLMEKVGSGGFFMSAFDAETVADARTYISGVKGYLCAGNCTPPGDEFLGTGALNYAAWNNWDVASGNVDLIGNGFFDLVPGNGLYPDLVGSSAPFQGHLRSKMEFTFAAGNDYRLSYKLAGNQRADATPYAVRVTVGGLVNRTRDMNDWRQDFTQYTEDFTGDGSVGRIGFLSEIVAAGFEVQSFGILLDSVHLENLTTGMILFMDDFDNENLQYVGPACGAGTVYGQGYGGYGYAYGYACYGYGCLAEPIRAQRPDPNPPPGIESEDVTPAYVSTQSYTASCPAGTTGADVTREATYSSQISLADANAHALLLAQAAAEAALVCLGAPTNLINLDAFVYGSGETESEKTGMAVLGEPGDYWNPLLHSLNLPLKDSAGNPTDAFLRLVDMYDYVDPTGEIGYRAIGATLDDHPDAMYRNAVEFLPAVGSDPNPTAFGIQGLEEGLYTLVAYAHGPTAEDASTVALRVCNLTGDPDNGFTVASPFGTYAGSEIADAAGFLSPAWAELVNFVRLDFEIPVGSGLDTILIQIAGNSPLVPAGRVFLNGIQLQKIG